MQTALAWMVIGMTALLVTGCVGPVGGAASNSSGREMIFPGFDWVEASPQSQGVDAVKLAEAMEVLAGIGADHKDGTPHTGHTRTVVIRNGRMIWKGSDIDTVGPVHSCTKSFTSSVFGLLVDDEVCRPGTLVCEVLPELAQQYPQVTFGHMANLTSGYNVPWRESAFVVRVANFDPGTAMHYNGAGHQLAHAFTVLADEPIAELWRKRLAEPIGIPADSWKWDVAEEIDGKPIHGGASGVAISARQMARFGHLYLNKGRWGDKQILSEDWVELSTTPQVAAHTRPFQRLDIWYHVLPGRYGYNWWINGIGSDGRRYWPNAPDGVFFAQGNRNNHCIIIPEWNMVFVHLDQGKPISSREYDKVFAVLREAVNP